MMLRQNVLELWSSITERLSQPDLRKIVSLLVEFKHDKIEKTQLISSALLLLENDKYLHRRFTEIFCANKPEEEQEDEDGETRNDEDTDIEEGEIREQRDPKTDQDEANHLEIVGVEVDENQKEDQEDEANHLEIRVKVDENPKEDSFAKINLEGKKKRKRGSFLVKDSNEIERSLKKTRTSKRLERVTPSYRHVLEEEQSSVSDTDTVLNNQYVSVGQRKGEVWECKKLTDYEEAMAKCEQHMYETDMLIGTLGNAMKSAEKVMSGEIELEDVGIMFYRCIDQLYRLDMAETVREDHRKVLPVIIPRLKQKLDEIKLARERWKPLWKQVFEENTAKQRDYTARGRKKK